MIPLRNSNLLTTGLPVFGLKIPRRRFVFIATVISFGNFFAKLRGQENQKNEAFEKGLQSWMEALFPSDADSPGAGKLNIHLDILKKGRGEKNYLHLMQTGVRWADREAIAKGKRSFPELDPKEAEAIVAKAEEKGTGDTVGLFFAHTLYDGTRYYYSRAESWSGIAYPHPPQPTGFVNHAEAPENG